LNKKCKKHSFNFYIIEKIGLSDLSTQAPKKSDAKTLLLVLGLADWTKVEILTLYHVLQALTCCC
jgi:hypothetical protein